MKNKIINQKMNCDIRLTSIEYWKGKNILIPKNSTYSLTIDYPFSIPGIFKLQTKKSVGLIELLKFIHKCYEKQYKIADKDEDNSYWHGIEDLVIEGININHKTKKITLYIGS